MSKVSILDKAVKTGRSYAANELATAIHAGRTETESYLDFLVKQGVLEKEGTMYRRVGKKGKK